MFFLMVIGMACAGMISMHSEVFTMIKYVPSPVVMHYCWVSLLMVYTLCKQGEKLMLVELFRVL